MGAITLFPNFLRRAAFKLRPFKIVHQINAVGLVRALRSQRPRLRKSAARNVNALARGRRMRSERRRERQKRGRTQKPHIHVVILMQMNSLSPAPRFALALFRHIASHERHACVDVDERLRSAPPRYV